MISVIIINLAMPSLVTSLNPDVLAELGGHAHKESLTLGCDSFMEVVSTATDNLQVHTYRTEADSGQCLAFYCNVGD